MKLVAFLNSYVSCTSIMEYPKEYHELIVEDKEDEFGTQWVQRLGSVPLQEAERVLDDVQNKILRGIDPR
jgi:hypothetical protein